MVVVADAAVEEVAVAVDLAVTIDRSVGSAKKGANFTNFAFLKVTLPSIIVVPMIFESKTENSYYYLHFIML